MTHFHSYQEIISIETEAWRAFDCQPEAWRAFDCRPVATRRGGKKRDAKRDKVTAVTNRFFDAMMSDDPPKTKDDAVTMLTPVLGLLLSIFFKQLAVTVIEWLWDRTKESRA